MKAKRRAFTAKPGPVIRTSRTPTVRRIKSAITPARPKAPGPGVAPVPTPAEAGTSAAVDAIGGRPVSLAVDLGRGLVLENPLIVASGPFGYGVEVGDAVDLERLGGIVTRSTTLKPRSGHAAPRMADAPAGVLLGMGLQNPGIDVVIERYAPTWAKWPVPVIVSLAGESASDVVDAARRLEGVPGVAGIELNLSVPNGSRGGSSFGLDADEAASFVRAVRRATDLPLIAKLTPAASDPRSVARAVEDAGADAISAINTLPGLALDADRTGPALGSGYGGLSGPALRPIALRVVFEIAQGVDIPIIGTGGVTTIHDVLDLMAAGATAIGVGIAALADPMLPIRLADELADACRARGMTTVKALVGTALPKRPLPPSARGAEYAR